MKHYIAFYDDGHDYGEFEYVSDYRNGSKANMRDAKEEFRRKFGSRLLQKVHIYHTELSNRD